MTEKQYLNHEEVHANIEIWCLQAADLMTQLINNMEQIEQRLGNLEARLREWEIGPR